MTGTSLRVNYVDPGALRIRHWLPVPAASALHNSVSTWRLTGVCGLRRLDSADRWW